MSVQLTINGVAYTFPELDDEDWGTNVSAWATAVTSGMLQKAGGTFALTAEVDFGASFGIKSISYKSRSSDIGSIGIVRLARTDKVVWRNQANNDDLVLEVNSSDQLVFNGDVVAVV